MVRAQLALNPTTAERNPQGLLPTPQQGQCSETVKKKSISSRGQALPHGPMAPDWLCHGSWPSLPLHFCTPASGPPPPHHHTPVRPNDRTSTRRLCLHPAPLQHRRGAHPCPEPPPSGRRHPTLSFLPSRTLGLFKVTMPSTPH